MSSFFNFMKAFFSKFYYFAFLIGTLVLISLMVEFIPSIPRKINLFYKDVSGIARHEHVDNPKYGQVNWVNDYWFEQTNRLKNGWQPYVYWRQKPLNGRHINIDNLGRRLTVQTVADDQNPLLVYMFGGSTMWGWGVPDQHTIPSELAKIVKDHNVKIVNYGELGYVTTQEYLQLMVALRRGERPDLVVFYDGFNDSFVTTFGYGAGWPHNETNRQKEFGLSLNSERWRAYTLAMKYAFRRSLKTAKRASEAFFGPQEAVAMSQEEVWDEAKDVISVYKFNMNLVRDLGKRYHFKSIFFVQPILGVNPKELPNRSEKADIFQASYSMAHEEFFEDNDVIFLDDILLSRPEYFLDICHLTQYGNQIIAKAIYENLWDKISVNRRK